jgi:DNA-binding NtrC family response regulator
VHRQKREQEEDPSAAAPRAAVVDPSAERRAEVASLVAGLGAQVPALATAEQALERAAGDEIDCALLAVDQILVERPAFVDLVRALRRRQIPVLCYADGAEAWPLSLRCRLLMAGAHLLFDSARSDFGRALGGELATHFGRIRDRQADQRRLEATMAQLGIVGSSAPMLGLMRAIARLAPLSEVPAVILGETGSGKELVARALHQLDPCRRHGPMLTLNCAALTASLAETELFGHKRGAFSGAERSRPGLFRAASGGVLFLDEIGDLPLDLQGKLLRVLQERRVLTVGEDEETAVDVRVVCATHRDLAAMVRDGRFREDLWQRLSVVNLRVPALRERRSDIPALVDAFLAKHAPPYGVPRQAAPEYLDALKRARLTGNVRQLENLVRRSLAVVEHDRPLGLADLPPELWQELSAEAPPAEVAVEAAPAEVAHLAQAAVATAGISVELNLARALDACERHTVEQALAQAGGSQTRAADLLGITGRSVYNKIRKHRLRSE